MDLKGRGGGILGDVFLVNRDGMSVYVASVLISCISLNLLTLDWDEYLAKWIYGRWSTLVQRGKGSLLLLLLLCMCLLLLLLCFR